jgi:hypothetical protein
MTACPDVERLEPSVFLNNLRISEENKDMVSSTTFRLPFMPGR